MLNPETIAGLLGFRTPVEVFASPLTGTTVLVTGAGGSIGSFLSAQIAACRPTRLILVDNNEYRLYEVHRTLQSIAMPVLSDFGRRRHLSALMREFNVRYVFHVGAYKHVPLVERNPVAALENNVLGSLELVEACAEANVHALTIISTDKAVKPSSVMGVSKLVVEQLALAHPIMGSRTRVVRFGNVLWSSGSVLPLFQEQLIGGVAVTVTDPLVDRYFMTVQQATSLILQTQGLPAGTYVLDMGEPVKIVDLVAALARTLAVEYSIRYIGLRDGEKLHEELTLGDNLHPTLHPDILEAREAVMPWAQVSALLTHLQALCDHNDVAGIRTALEATGLRYNPACGIVDDLWLQQYGVKAYERLPGDCFQACTAPE